MERGRTRCRRRSLVAVTYYLREGLLPQGRATGATQAEYDETHMRRLVLIRVLIGVGGLSLAETRGVLRCMAEFSGYQPGQMHSADRFGLEDGSPLLVRT